MAKVSVTANLLIAIERLSKRERYMVIGASITFVIFVSVMLGWWISSSLHSLERRVDTKTRKLQVLIDKRQEFDEAKLKLKSAERVIHQGRSIQLMGTVEDFATRLGVAIEDMQPRTASVNTEANVREEKVEVNIKLITIDRLVDFLRQIERKSKTIAIRKLHIKQNFQQPDQLEVGFTVSNFKLIDEKKSDSNSTQGKDKPKNKHRTKG